MWRVAGTHGWARGGGGTTHGEGTMRGREVRVGVPGKERMLQHGGLGDEIGAV